MYKLIKSDKKNFLILKKLSMFNDLDENLLEKFSEKCEIVFLRNKKNSDNEFQIKTEEKIYIFIEGMAFLSFIDESGKKIIFDILGKESLIGYLDFGEEEHSANLFVEPFPKDTIKILSFEKNYFISILKKNDKLAMKILSIYSQRMLRLEKKIEELVFLGLKNRVLYELTRLAGSYSETNKIIKLNFRITHEKLAEATGAVRETVSKALRELRDEGYISYDKEKKLIINLGKLEQF